jgi:hypothetical protein
VKCIDCSLRQYVTRFQGTICVVKGAATGIHEHCSLTVEQLPEAIKMSRVGITDTSTWLSDWIVTMSGLMTLTKEAQPHEETAELRY